MKTSIQSNPSSLNQNKSESQQRDIPAPSREPGKFWDQIVKFTVYTLVFLLPLWFLPWTINVLDFQKQALLGTLTFITLLFWLAKTLVAGRFEFNTTLLNIPVLLLLLVSAASTIFSIFRYGSFWGWPTNIAASFLTFLWLVVFYFLIGNVLRKQDTFKVLFLLCASGFLAALFGILQFFGKFLLPWDFTRVSFFNTIGTVNSFSVFLASVLPVTICLIPVVRKIARVILALFALTMLLAVLLVNSWVAWVVLLVASAILFFFGTSAIRNIPEKWWIFLPMTLLVIALLLVTFRFSLLTTSAIPVEVSPGYHAGLEISKKVLGQSPILGTGPGTFVYNYSRYRSTDLNQTLFWNVRFGSGPSELLDKLMTTGILGIFAFFLTLGMSFWVAFRYLKSQLAKDRSLWLMRLGIFAGFSGTIAGQCLYSTNLSLIFLFWFFLGGLALVTGQTKAVSFDLTTPLTLGASLVLLLIVVFGAGLIFLGAQKYLAEVHYLRGIEAWQKADNQQAIEELGRAITLNPKLDTYFRDTSQLYLLKTQETLQSPDLSAEEKTNQVQLFIANAVNLGQRATELNPANVAAWNARGFVYRNLIGLLDGAADWALQSYEKAVELEPSNPYPFTEMGLVYLSKSDILPEKSAENLNLAREKFQKALELKADYAPAHFQLAMIWVKEGKTKEAIDKLEELKTMAPFDAGLAFQTGILYYYDKQSEKAKAEFQRALSLDENYSNARYFLGLIYDQEGQRNLAIEQFERIGQLNPDNSDVKKILENLRANRAALEGITSAQPPVQEVPPERLEK